MRDTDPVPSEVDSQRPGAASHTNRVNNVTSARYDRAQAALTRLRAFFRGEPVPVMGPDELDAADAHLADLIGNGGFLYESGFRDFETWAARVREYFGPSVQDYLPPVFALIVTHWRKVNDVQDEHGIRYQPPISAQDLE